MLNAWDELTRGWLDHLAAGNRSPGTVALRRYHVERFARDIGEPPNAVTAAALVAWIAGNGWSASTKRSVRSSLRGFFAWATAVGHLRHDPAADLPTVLEPRRLPRPAGDDAIMSALRMADDRTSLIIELMAYCGLRRGEVAVMHSSRVVDTPHGPAIRVAGKGGHERFVPCPRHLAAAVRRRPGWTFPGQINGHLSPRRVGELVAEALPGEMTGHALRHRFGTVAYRRSRDIRAVQELLGHARLDTTSGYVAVSADDMASAAAAAWSLSA